MSVLLSWIGLTEPSASAGFLSDTVRYGQAALADIENLVKKNRLRYLSAMKGILTAIK
jgi:hypothetical protein